MAPCRALWLLLTSVAMPISLSDLAKRLTPATTTLLLGAGASMPCGAPSAADLAEYLTRELDASVDASLGLATAAELLELKVGRKAIMEALRSRLSGMKPSGGIAAIPRYRWRALYTTNYDRVVESAYRSAGAELAVVRSDFDMDVLESSAGIPYFKIHGCLSQDRGFGHQASMILTDSDYETFSRFREAIFDRMKYELEAGSVVIIGHSLRDPHIRDIVRRVAAIQQQVRRSNRVHLLIYNADPDIATLYERQGITVAFGGIDELFDAFADAMQPLPLATAAPATALPTPLLASTREVSTLLATVTPNAKRLFTGGEASYADIQAGYTFARTAETELTVRVIDNKAPVVITGVAGVGKTTMARRLLAALQSRGFVAWEHRAEMPLRPEQWASVDASLRTAGLRGVLLLDDVTRNQRRANELVAELWKGPTPPALSVLCTAEVGKWNVLVKRPEFFKFAGPRRLEALTENELLSLIDLLDSSDEINRLVEPTFRNLSRADKALHLRRRCESDMFVCLKNMFGFENLDNILLREFSDLSMAHQDVYRHVAAMHAAGIEVHRQLVIRTLGIETSSLLSMYDSLDGLIHEEDHSATDGIYTWRTRHRTIAETLAAYKFANQRELVDLFQRIIDGLNPAVVLERRSVSELCTSDYGIPRVHNVEQRIRLYESLIASTPDERVPRHRLVREFLDAEQLVPAEVALEEAVRIVGLDPPLQRYRVLLLLHKARTSTKMARTDREALLLRAKEQAEAGISRFKNNFYSYFIFDEVAREYLELTGDRSWVRLSCDYMAKAYEDLLDPGILSRLQKSERLLDRHGAGNSVQQ